MRWVCDMKTTLAILSALWLVVLSLLLPWGVPVGTAAVLGVIVLVASQPLRCWSASYLLVWFLSALMGLTSVQRQVLIFAPFSPQNLPGLAAWYRSDRGLWQDTAGTIPAVADGDPVGRWDDQSGNGRHLTQATAGLRPLLKLAIQNGRPVVRFASASSQYLTISGFNPLGGAFTSVLWGCPVSNSVGASYMAQTGSTSKYGIVLGSDGSIGAEKINVAYSSFSVLYTAAWHNFAWWGQGNLGGADVTTNGAVDNGQPGSSTLSSVAASSGLHVGFDGLAGSYWNGDMGEIVICGSILSVAHVTALYQYGKRFWNTP